MRTKTLVVALTATALAVGLSACTADDPEPRPSQSIDSTAEGDPAALSPSETPNPSDTPKPERGAFRSHPYEPGETFEFGDWELTFGETDLDATQRIIDDQLAQYGGDESYTTPPADGNVYITVPVTATYKGNTRDDPSNSLDYAYVTADGRSYAGLVLGVPFDGDLSDVGELYPGATGEGEALQEVPEGDAKDGYWRVSEVYMNSTAGEVYVGSARGQNAGKEVALDGTPCVYVDDVCFSQAELDAHTEEESGIGDLIAEDYLALAPEEQATINSDLEAAGKFAEWGLANPLTGPCAAQTAKGMPAQTLIEMGYGPAQCPND